MNFSFDSKPGATLATDRPTAAPVATPSIEPPKSTFTVSFGNSTPTPAVHSPAAKVGRDFLDTSNSAVAGVMQAGMPEKILDKKVLEFKGCVQALYQHFPQKEMLGMVMKRILIDLNNNPELEEFLAPEDRGQLIRALRDNYSVAAEAKKKKIAAKKPKKESAFGNLSDLLGASV